MTEEVERILGALRGGGGRITSARRAIVSAIVEAGGHVTAEQLTATVQARHPDVHESTVYRLLNDLTELDVVDHVHLGHGPAVYHLAEERHLHLVCEVCGRVIEVPAALSRTVSRQLRDEFGFHIDAGHFALTGRCEDCVRAGVTSAAPS